MKKSTETTATPSTSSPEQLQEQLDALLDQKGKIALEIEEIEKQLLAGKHNVFEALRGTQWRFDGDYDGDSSVAVSPSDARLCMQFTLFDEDDLPSDIKKALRASGHSELIDLGSPCGYERVFLQTHDGEVSLRFGYHKSGDASPLKLAKELGLRLDFCPSQKHANDEVRKAEKRRSILEKTIQRARTLLGDDNVAVLGGIK